MAARIAIIAMTTRSSISVNAARGVQRGASPPLVAAVSEADVRRRGITRLFFAYFLFPLKRK
jgi:hypothetical protein